MKEYGFEAILSLPNKDSYAIKISLSESNYSNAEKEAINMVITEENLKDEDKKYIQMELVYCD